jgi:GMP synthase-like glutamine amidotransferase
VLGENVFRGENGFEIGWKSLQRTPAGVADPVLSAIPEDVQFLEWHQDTFTLPKGATLLASTEQYEYQIYRYGSMFAVQFHPELDEENIRLWHAHKLATHPEIAPPLDDLMRDVDKRTDAASRLMDAFWKDVLDS